MSDNLTWEELELRLRWDSSSWTINPDAAITSFETTGEIAAVKLALRYLYEHSSTAQDMISDWAKVNLIRIGETGYREVGATVPGAAGYIGLNLVSISEYYYINDHGVLVQEELALTIVHELIHLIKGATVSDPKPGSGTPTGNAFLDSVNNQNGTVVDLQNIIAAELSVHSAAYADNQQVGYHATAPMFDIPSSFLPSNFPNFQLNYSYSEGNTVTNVRVGFRGANNDVINHSARTDPGNRDLLLGLDGDDTISGGRGHDYIYGGEGSDVLRGGSGNDLLHGADVLNPGADAQDTADYSLGDDGLPLPKGIVVEIVYGASSLTLDGRQVFRVTDDGYGTIDRLVSIERITATDLEDTFKFAGQFEAGLDLRINAKSSVAHPDTIDLSGSTTGYNLTISATNVGTLQAAAGGGSVLIENFLGAVVGSGGADHIETAGAAIHISGGGGADELVGGAGDDVLVGADDAVGDTLTGGGGTDIFVVGDGDVVTDASGQDRLAISPTSFITGQALRDEGSTDPYINAAGQTFHMDGDDLVIVAGGATIRVEDFQDGDLGITLRERDDDEVDEPGDDDGPGPGGASGGFLFPMLAFVSPPMSPLVLDLDGDGLEITSLSGSQVHFDLDASGSRERTGWLGGDDGFLVFDADASGTIDDGRELFGNADDNGFSVLSFYDGRTGGNYYSNPGGGSINPLLQDGVIDADDPIWGSLRIWRDLDQDGVSDAGELFSLAGLGIQSIDLGYATTSIDVHEHEIRQTSTAQTTGGAIEIADVWFSTDRTDTIHDYDPNTVGFEGWPDLHAIGGIRTLRHAMSLDADLALDVEAFIRDAEVLSLDSLQARFTDILLAWAGVDDRPLTGRGDFFPDARILEFLELAHDRDYLQLEGVNAGLADPGPSATYYLLQAFGHARDALMLQFLSQLPEHHLAEAMAQSSSYQVSRFAFLSSALDYDLATGLYTFDAVQFLRAVAPFDPSDLTSVDRVADVLEFSPLLGAILDVEPADFLADMQAAATEAGRPDLRAVIDWFLAQPEDGGTLSRGVVRLATEGQTIAGTGLSDLVVVDEGLGTVTLGWDLSADRIILTSAFDGASWSADYDPETGDLTVHFAAQDVTLVLTGYLSGSVDNIVRGADVIYFADGGVLDLAALREAATGQATSGDDTRNGTGFDETLDGLDGADIIHAGDGEDLLRGGEGDDVLIGGRDADVIDGGAGDDQLGASGASNSGGADTYVFQIGDGHDTLHESASGNIVDMTETAVGDVRLAWSGADLVVTFVGRPADSVTIIAFRTTETVSTFRFAGGVERTYQQIVDEALLQAASPGNDTVTGSTGHDTLVGGLGDDVLYGASSSLTSGDTFLYRLGDGDDVIHASYRDTDDELVLIGIDAGDVTVTRTGNDAVLSFAGGGSVTLHDQFQTYGWNVLERIVFDSGVTWTERDLAFAVQAPQTTPTVTGTSAAETLDGTTGRDVFEGGAGNDLLRGGGGSDTYLFGAGSGNDTILDQGGDDAFDVDVVRIDALAADVTVSRQGDDVVFTLIGGETLTVQAFFTNFSSRLNGSTAVERVIFSDGAHWDAAQVARLAWIRGTSGDDHIDGRGGADTIVGGAGDDTLDGGYGDDVYLVRSGDGDDIVDEDDTGGEDFVWFQDANLADVRVVLVAGENDPHQLRIERLDETGSVTLIRFGSYASIEGVRFADGTTLDLDALTQLAIVQGSEAGETLYGRGSADQFYGHGGADELIGGYGFDTYHWSRGDGDDVIVDYADDADLGQLVLHGIDPSLVALNRVPTAYEGGGALYDLIVTIQPLMDGDIVETITIARFFAGNGGDYEGVTRIVFDNGVVWERTDLVRNSTLSGTATEDFLIGTELGEILDSGAGDDVMEGRYGSDTYLWKAGDGNDEIRDGGERWDTDTLRLVDVELAGVTFSRDGDDLLIHILSTEEVITVMGQFSVYDPEGEGNPDYQEGFERLVFASGLELTPAEILALIPPDPDPDPEEATPGPDSLHGGVGDDYLRGLEGDDTLDGGEGGDSLEGGEGDDLLVGGLGDDWLVGGEGADIYAYHAGDGSDSIWDAGSGADLDVLNLVDVDWADANVVYDSFGFRIELPDATISISSMFADEMGYSPGANDAEGIETFVFADEIGRTARDLLDAALSAGGVDLAYGAASADVLTGGVDRDALIGGDGDDSLAGAGADDRLFGGLGEDVLEGGSGDDELVGGQGADIYIYGAGDGDDLLIDYGDEGADVLQLGPGLLQASVSITRSFDNAILSFAGGGSILLEGQFSGWGVEAIDFASGVDWTVADIYARYLSQAGTSGADSIVGSNGADLLDGGAGDDELAGEEGSDTYLFASGSGVDIIYEYDSSDVSFDEIVFAAGLDSTAVTVERDASNPDDIILVFATGESVRITEGLGLDPAEARGIGIEQITFGDSVVWTRADVHDAYLANAATSGDDTIVGFRLYDDIMAGGAGADTFVFTQAFGNDVISDFSLVDDFIHLMDRTDFGAIMASASQVGTDVVFDFGEEGTLTLVGIDILDLTEAHFGLL